MKPNFPHSQDEDLIFVWASRDTDLWFSPQRCDAGKKECILHVMSGRAVWYRPVFVGEEVTQACLDAIAHHRRLRQGAKLAAIIEKK